MNKKQIIACSISLFIIAFVGTLLGFGMANHIFIIELTTVVLAIYQLGFIGEKIIVSLFWKFS